MSIYAPARVHTNMSVYAHSGIWDEMRMCEEQ